MNSLNPLIIDQDPDGYRYSIEPFLLAHFIDISRVTRVLDIGTGCGIIPILTASRAPLARIVGVEIQHRLADRAKKNVEQNDLDHRIEVINEDFSEVASRWDEESFDLIVSNPPYRKINTGRTNPHPGKAIARHELALTLPTLVKHGNSLLKTGGKIALAYPPARLVEVIRELEVNGLALHRLRFIHGNPEADARIFLADAVKGQRIDCIVEDPLYVYNKDGSYSREMEEIYASFNYSGRPDYLEKERDRRRAC